MEELKAMTLIEFGNAKRKIRGQDTIAIRNPKPPKTHDNYGIFIIHEENIPKEACEKEISRVSDRINSHLSDFRQVVFPNTPVDLINEYDNGFYKDELDRTLRYEDYQTVDYYEPGDTQFHISFYKNDSKRTYYYNERDQLKMIEVEAGINVNKGEKRKSIKNKKDEYYLTRYYPIHDSLLLITNKSFWVYYGEDERILRALSDSLVFAKSWKVYLYKDNWFKTISKEGMVRYDHWEEDLDKLTFSKPEYSHLNSNKHAVKFKNFLTEYEEYKTGENNYLMPIPASFIKEPYVIPGSWEK